MLGTLLKDEIAHLMKIMRLSKVLANPEVAIILKLSNSYSKLNTSSGTEYRYVATDNGQWLDTGTLDMMHQATHKNISFPSHLQWDTQRLDMIMACSLSNEQCKSDYYHAITDKGVCNTFNGLNEFTLFQSSPYLSAFRDAFALNSNSNASSLKNALAIFFAVAISLVYHLEFNYVFILNLYRYMYMN